MRSKLQAHCILIRTTFSQPVASLMRPKFLPPPNPSSMRNPLVRNPETCRNKSASRQPEQKASVDADVAGVADADEVDAAASRPSPKPSVPRQPRAFLPTCPAKELKRPKRERLK